jgi:hypothetical protein
MVEGFIATVLKNQNSPSANFASLEEQLPEPHENERLRIKNWQQIWACGLLPDNWQQVDGTKV